MLFNSGMIEKSEFSIIKGYTSENELNSLLSKFHDNKDYVVFPKFDCIIEAPSYDEAVLITSIVPDITKLNNAVIGNVIDKFFFDMPESVRRKMMLSTEIVIRGIEKKPNMTPTLLKNYFVKLIKAYDSSFLDVISALDSVDKKYILYSGKLNDYYVAILSAFYKMGVNIVIFANQEIKPPILLPVTYFEGDKGGFEDLKKIYEALDAGVAVSTVSLVCRNDWAALDSKDFDRNLNRLITQNRFANIDGKVNCLSLGYTGINTSVASYKEILSNFYATNKNKILLIDKKLKNPEFEETTEINNLNLKDNFKIAEYLDKFSGFKKYSMIVANDFVRLFGCMGVSQQKNYFIWLIRVLKAFFNSGDTNYVPVIVLFGHIETKTREFLPLLHNLPVDIVHFAPNISDAISEIAKYVLLGESNTTILDFPVLETQVVSTVAYNAEQEVHSMIYNDESNIYKYKQYKKYNLARIKTTYDEIDILWNEPFKFRSGFATVNGIVTTPSFFVKISGVSGTREEYIESIKRKLVKGTIFLQKKALQFGNFGNMPMGGSPSEMNNSFIQQNSNIRSNLGMPIIDTGHELPFLRQLWFSNQLDKDRLLRSNYWHYGRFSEDTRNLLLAKMEEILKSSMIDMIGYKNFPQALQAMLNIDTNIINLVHQNDYTGASPKLVVFDGAGAGLSMEECVQIMYLNALCFDVLVYAPTGYVTIENYIPSQYYDSMTIGKYEFDYGNVDITAYQPRQKQKGFLSSLFG